MRYSVDRSWTMTDTVEVEAESPEQAVSAACRMTYNPAAASYVPHSMRVDADSDVRLAKVAGRSGKAIIYRANFRSSHYASNGVTYETLAYADGSLSCNCRGWTQRNQPGGRFCRHTEEVEANRATWETQVAQNLEAAQQRQAVVPVVLTQTFVETKKRKFALE